MKLLFICMVFLASSAFAQEIKIVNEWITQSETISSETPKGQAAIRKKLGDGSPEINRIKPNLLKLKESLSSKKIANQVKKYNAMTGKNVYLKILIRERSPNYIEYFSVLVDPSTKKSEYFFSHAQERIYAPNLVLMSLLEDRMNELKLRQDFKKSLESFEQSFVLNCEDSKTVTKNQLKEKILDDKAIGSQIINLKKILLMPEVKAKMKELDALTKSKSIIEINVKENVSSYSVYLKASKNSKSKVHLFDPNMYGHNSFLNIVIRGIDEKIGSIKSEKALQNF